MRIIETAVVATLILLYLAASSSLRFFNLKAASADRVRLEQGVERVKCTSTSPGSNTCEFKDGTKSIFYDE